MPEHHRLVIQTPVRAELQPILCASALDFIAALTREFGPRVAQLLQARAARQERIDAGEMPDFLPQTRAIREAEWQVARIPADLWDRRVEITGPTDRKMIINALNSGAKVFMADCEDSLSPTWDNVVNGQQNLYDAVRRTIELVSDAGKVYRLNRETAVLILRPRGWHLFEKHVTHDGQPVPGAFVDFGLYLFFQRAAVAAAGHRPVFLFAQAREPSRGAPLGRGICFLRAAARPASRQHQMHRAHRDDSRGL